VCAETDLPIAWATFTASAAEQPQVPDLLDEVSYRGFSPKYALMDMGYDGAPTYAACESRRIHPIIPLKRTAEVENGKDKAPTCEHGAWKFAGASVRRQAAKWRCPTGECDPASTWVSASRLHTLVPRHTRRWKDLYAKRGSVEREFGRLKHQWGMLPLRTRTLRRVSVHVDFSMLTCLAMALADARRQVPIAA
jgi:Transposase DDE domain